jgi:hypothetical protein
MCIAGLRHIAPLSESAVTGILCAGSECFWRSDDNFLEALFGALLAVTGLDDRDCCRSDFNLTDFLVCGYIPSRHLNQF